jgi:hypothetical protein
MGVKASAVDATAASLTEKVEAALRSFEDCSEDRAFLYQVVGALKSVKRKSRRCAEKCQTQES